MILVVFVAIVLDLLLKLYPAALQLLSVVKDEAYGHGALPAARVAREAGVTFFAVSTVEEAMALRDAGIRARLLLLGDRQESAGRELHHGRVSLKNADGGGALATLSLPLADFTQASNPLRTTA